VAAPDRYNSRTAVLPEASSIGTSPSECVLGVDPGLTRTGWAVLAPLERGYNLVSAGIIASRGSERFEWRLAEGYRRFDALLEEHAPGLVVMEDLFATPRFPGAALKMAHLRGVLCLAAELRDIPVMSLTATTVKQRLTGNGHASKEQVQRMVFQLCDLGAATASSDLSDAIALAIAGCHQTASGSYGLGR
jgi:crossover junction endodeoxyribonuclease RuvC